MLAEIIAIGSELTSGAKLDTNSQWLSQQLARVGIPVQYHTTMADTLEHMVNVLRLAASRSDLAILTGGLGPTLDDITRQALAELAGVELELHEPSLQFIQELFARRGRTMSERNRIQAMFPRGSSPLPNPRGTAPGIWLEFPRPGSSQPVRFAALPGVPDEMKRMFQFEVLPRLGISRNVIQSARLNCYGMGESQMEELLGDITARGRDPEVGITASMSTITLRINAMGQTEEECRRKITVTSELIRVKLGHLIFGEEDEELEDAVLRLLRNRGRTLATVESGAGGLLAHRFTRIPGHESQYLGGLTLPTDAAKIRLLDIPAELIQEHGTPSAMVTLQTAIRCRAKFGADYALALSESPPFDVDDLTQVSPAAYVALSGEGGEIVTEYRLLGDPEHSRIRAAKTAANLLRLHLLQQEAG